MGSHKSTSYDSLRDGPLRYLGYCNEVGEAFRPMIPVSFVKLSYGVSFGYVIADTNDKWTKARENGLSSEKQFKVVYHTLIWQTLASVLIPGFTINRIVRLSSFALKLTRLSQIKAFRGVPTVIGLASIPLIINPIDNFVDKLMDSFSKQGF